jgi:hypothetical protein
VEDHGLSIVAALDIAFDAKAPRNRCPRGQQRIFRHTGAMQTPVCIDRSAQPTGPCIRPDRQHKALKQR